MLWQAYQMKRNVFIPEKIWLFKDCYSDEEINVLEQLLYSNAHLFYKYASNGGIQIA